MTRESAYKLRRSDHARAFARAWDAARQHAGSYIEDMAFERALEGVEHNVYDENGEVVCTKRVYNDRLLTYLLSHLKPERYGRMAQLLNAQAQLAQVQAMQVKAGQVQAGQVQAGQVQAVEVETGQPHDAQLQRAEDQIAETQIEEAQIAEAHIDDVPDPDATVAQDENALVAIIAPHTAPALIEQVPSVPPVSLDALLREMEPQMPAPPEAFLDRETLGHELMMAEMNAEMYDNELPPHFREQRPAKSAEKLKAEALAAKYARGEAIYDRTEKEPDGKKSKLSDEEADDLYFYIDPTSRNSPGRKRFR